MIPVTSVTSDKTKSQIEVQQIKEMTFDVHSIQNIKTIITTVISTISMSTLLIILIKTSYVHVQTFPISLQLPNLVLKLFNNKVNKNSKRSPQCLTTAVTLIAL